MENIIQVTPNFDSVFAHNDQMALGAAKTLRGKNIIVVGFHGNEEVKKAVENGEITATVAQQPDLMGIVAIENAIKILKKEKTDQEISVDLKLIKK